MNLRATLAALFTLFLIPSAHADLALHRGFNFGDMLEEPKEGVWSGLKLQSDYLKIIHDAGFDTIRVPIDWVAHAGPAPDYTIDPKFFTRIDEVISEATSNHLTIVLDYQVDNELVEDPDHNSDRFLTLWKQIAEHYQTQPDSVYFELLNEAHDKLTAPKWNALIVRALAVIRPSNPTRTVVVGAIQWNSFDKLPELQLPDSDQHLLVTFHYYNPMQFTHQGASWIGPVSQSWLGTKWEGTDAQKAVIVHDFGAADAWGNAHHRPIYLGEFGSYSTGDMASRVRWTTCCARTSESLGMRWTYWEFCSGFGAYDPKAHEWRKPLLDALMPPSP
jgi:endoglucanase